MTCERCDGLMMSERICDLNGTSGDVCVDGYRCLLCGDLVDAVILENRHQAASVRVTTQKVPRLPRLVAA